MQYGTVSEAEFQTMSLGVSEPSVFNKWPTKNQTDRVYKLTSLWLEQGQKRRIIERSTYSVLELIGDVGGLFDGLKLIANALIGPLAAYAMNKEFFTRVFKRDLHKEE